MSSDRQVTVTLTEDIAEFVRTEARRGAFSSDGDYILDLVRSRFELDRQLKSHATDTALHQEIDDADSGRVMETEDALARLRQEIGLKSGS